MIRVASLPKSFVLLLSLSFLGLTSAHGQTKGPVDDKTFLKLQQDWAEARKHADMAFLESFYAKEFTVGNMDGGESSRQADLPTSK
jgi:hypothetical protein